MKILSKKIVSLFLAVCMFLSVMPALTLTASAEGYWHTYETVELGETIYVYGDSSMDQAMVDKPVYYFTPEKDGLYKIRMYSSSGSDMGWSEVFEDVDEYTPVPCVGNTMNHESSDEMNDMGMLAQYYYYYLEGGEIYDVAITPANGMYGGCADTEFTIYEATETALAELKVGSSYNITTSDYELNYMTFVPETDGEVIIDFDGSYSITQWININTGETDASWDGQLDSNFTAGNTYYITISGGGEYTVNVFYPEVTDNTTVTTSDIADMQSSHYYANNLDKTWKYTAPEGTIFNEVTFDKKTNLFEYDYLYIYDESGTQIGIYDTTDLSGKTVIVSGQSFSVRLVTNSRYVDYGFKLSDIKSYSEVPVPTASVESGVIKPSTVTISKHSLAEAYYKITTGTSAGEFALYSSAISIDEDCTLEIYAKIGDKVSETVSYTYTIDMTLPEPPTFAVYSKYASYMYLTLSATEGTIYYKRLLSDSSFKAYTAGSKIYVSGDQAVAAYTQNGVLKSEIVYYNCDFEDTGSYDLEAPIITITPVMGGKEIMVSLPDGVELYSNEDKVNYAEDHDEYGCGMDEWTTHDFGPWSYTLEEYYSAGYFGNASKSVSLGSYETSEFPKTYSVTENTSVRIKLHWNKNTESGQWYSMPMDEWGSMYYHTRYGGTETDSSYESAESPTVYQFIEVPKATAPEISVESGKIAVSGAESEEVELYVSVNGGEYQKYTEAFSAASGDVIKAYAIGMGLAKSNESEFTAQLEGILIKETSVWGGKEVEITAADASAEIYYSTDGEKYDVYTEKLFIEADTTVYAYTKKGEEISDTESLSVTVEKAEVPKASHENGTYPVNTQLEFTTESTALKIYYVTTEGEGEEATEITTEYTKAITLTDDLDIKVYAVGIGIAKSEETAYSYKLLRAEPPTFEEADIMGGKSISIKTASEGGKIFYSTDNADFNEYTEPVECYDYATVYAYTVLEGASNSKTEKYDVTMLQTKAPNPNYASGEVFKGTKIILESVNDDLETAIYYTLDESTPDKTKTLYTADGITITEPVTVKAVAYSMGRAVSDEISLTYTIRTTTKPSITEENVKGGKKIYLESTTEESKIYYTTDGTDPKTSETKALYEAPFIIGESGTVLKAYAVADKYLDSTILEYTVEIGQLATPTFSVKDENVYVGTTVELKADSFADIYYTFGNGNVPTKESTRYTEPIVINDDVQINAIAVSDGWTTSDISTQSYAVYKTGVPYIVRTKAGDCMKIEIKSETPDAVIYYTLDASEPDKNSSIYSEPLMLSKDTTVRAFAVSEKRKDSAVYTEFVMVRHTTDPVASVPSGKVKIGDKIELTGEIINESSTNGVTIYYTLDGTTPTEESNVYTEPITIEGDTILKAFATEENCLDSNVVTYEYTVERTKNPEILLNEDILGGKSIKIESSEEGAVIYYTLDGSEPTKENAKLYSEPFNIYKNTVIRAFAEVEGYSPSDVIQREMAVPVATNYCLKDDGSYYSLTVLKGEPVGINISDQMAYYTIDGTEPTLSSSLYQPYKNQDLVFTDGGAEMKVFAIGYGYAKSETANIRIFIAQTNAYRSVEYHDDGADVTLRSTPSGATIYYTLDDTLPTTESAVYTGPIRITENTIIRTLTVADKYNSSYNLFKIYINKAKNPEILFSGEYYSKDNYTKYIKRGDKVKLYSPDGLSIRYTTDGSTPSETNGEDYKEPIVIDEETCIRAYCYAENYENSDVKSYEIKFFKAFGDISAENVIGGKNIEVVPKAGYIETDETKNIIWGTVMGESFGAFTVYYTIDGSEPTEDSPVYMKVNENGVLVTYNTEGIFAKNDITVKTLVISDDCESGGVYTNKIEVNKLNMPAYLPSDTSVYKNTYIVLESAEPDAVIYYTTDGSEPDTDSILYTEPFTLSDHTTIKAIAVKPGMATSDTVTASYRIKQVATPSYTEEMTASGKLMTLSCGTENAKLYYTTDGTVPTENSNLYTQPFKLKKNTTIRIVAVCENMKESYEVTALIEVPFSEMSVVGVSDKAVSEGGYVEVPLYVQKNPGIAAYAISVEYDNALLTPVSAENLWGGIFTTNIDKGAESNIENAVSLVWLGNSNKYDNGDFAKLIFKVADGAEAQETTLYIKENGVINNLYQQAEVVYMDGLAAVSGESSAEASSLMSLRGSTVYTDTKLNMTSRKIDGETLEVSVMIEENSGIGAYNLSLLYDKEALTPVSVSNGELFESDLMSNVTQPDADKSALSEITVLSCNDKNTTENGVLFTVCYQINSESAEGQLIGFSDVKLLNTSGDKIVGTYEDGEITEEIKTTTVISNGVVTVTPDNVPAGSTVIIACYKNEVLVFSNETVFNNQTTVTADASNVDFDTVKVFVWDSLKPLTKTETKKVQ